MIGLWLKRLIAYWCGIELILVHFFKPFSEIVWPSTEMLRHSKAYTTPLPMAEKRKLAGIYHPAHHNGQVIGSLLEDKQTGTNLYCRRKQLSLYNPHSSLFELIFYNLFTFLSIYSNFPFHMPLSKIGLPYFFSCNFNPGYCKHPRVLRGQA